jgi:hypothetical protein
MSKSATKQSPVRWNEIASSAQGLLAMAAI